MSELWGVVVGVCTSLGVLTALFLYVVRSEISREMAELKDQLHETFASKKELSVLTSRLEHIATCNSPGCGLRKKVEEKL